MPHMEWISTPETIQNIVDMTKNTVWDMEWNIFLAQCRPMYTALNKIVRASLKIRKLRQYFSVFEA